MKTLGQLQWMEPREIWSHEAHDFTPWLRENIAMLSEAVGLELDVVETESPVGDFSVDLYAKELGTNAWVVIENQLGSTDHGHLGQLLAYATGKEAGVVIWIATQFRDEHRQALTWLNEITGEDISFFGIEIELRRIDDSPPAPNFKLVVQPNAWAKRSRQGGGSCGVSATTGIRDVLQATARGHQEAVS